MISAAIIAWLAAGTTDLPAGPACRQPSDATAPAIRAASTATAAHCPLDAVVSVGVTPEAKDVSQPAIFTTEGRKGPIVTPSAPVPIV